MKYILVILYLISCIHIASCNSNIEPKTRHGYENFSFDLDSNFIEHECLISDNCEKKFIGNNCTISQFRYAVTSIRIDDIVARKYVGSVEVVLYNTKGLDQIVFLEKGITDINKVIDMSNCNISKQLEIFNSILLLDN